MRNGDSIFIKRPKAKENNQKTPNIFSFYFLHQKEIGFSNFILIHSRTKNSYVFTCVDITLKTKAAKKKYTSCKVNLIAWNIHENENEKKTKYRILQHGHRK